jgi:hypothetical protein
MFTIIIPVASAPIIITLAWAQQKVSPIPSRSDLSLTILDPQAKKLGLIATSYNSESVAIDVDSRPIAQRVYTNVSALDLFGLLLFAAGFSLLLIPLTLVNRAQDSFGASLISMIVIGCLLLVAFAVYEAKVAKSPIMPFRFFKSPTVVACCLIGFFDFISFVSVPTLSSSHEIDQDSSSVPSSSYPPFSNLRPLLIDRYPVHIPILVHLHHAPRLDEPQPELLCPDPNSQSLPLRHPSRSVSLSLFLSSTHPSSLNVGVYQLYYRKFKVRPPSLPSFRSSLTPILSGCYSQLSASVSSE